MACYGIVTFMLLTAVEAYVAADTCLSSVSWNDSRVDLFALTPNAEIAHKFWTGWDWQPSNGFERFPSKASSCPSVTSWDEGRLDILYVSGSGRNVLHKYFDGGSWGPSWEKEQDLGGDVESISSASWAKNRLDIVGKSKSGSYVHKAWTGQGWFPADLEWEDIGGNFFSNPATVSWGTGRLDIVGFNADNGSLCHKYYHNGWSEWEDLGGGPFIGNPVATSWGKGRLDFWAINSEGELNHLYWGGSEYSKWEVLGGEFTDTPKIVHWKANRIDIVGKGLNDDKYHSKSYDGSQWKPPGTKWNDLAGPFSSEPALEAKHKTNFLYLFGVTEEEDVRLQIWSGSDWQPGNDRTWSLGHLSSSSYGRYSEDAHVQEVLVESEL